MKIISLKCPECRADLYIEEGMTKCICSHCGSQIMLDDESLNVRFFFENADEAGYRFEQGRQRAQYDAPTNIELANKIQLIQDSYSDLHTLSAHAQLLQRTLTELQAQLDKISTPLVKLSPFLISCVILAIAIFAAVSGESFKTFIYGAFFAVALYFTISRILATKRYNLIEQINKETLDFRQTKKKMQEIAERADFDLIPAEYRNDDALTHFYKTLSSGRALNLNQAITLYEEDLKDEANRQLQMRQIRLQEQQLELLRTNVQNAVETPVPENKKKPNTVATILAIGGALYAGAKFLEELNDRNK